MITSFPIKDVKFESLKDSHLVVSRQPFFHSTELACHVCKSHTTNGVMTGEYEKLYILSACLFASNMRYYYVPHETCRALFNLTPLAYE